MARKETRYGEAGQYVRRKIKNPLTGDYVAVYGRTVTEREEKIRTLEAAWARELEQGESPYFHQYAAAWYGRVSPDMTPQRREVIAREINNNICPVIGEKRLCELTADDVMDVLAARTARSRSARERTLQTLRRICKAAVRAGKLLRDPTDGVTPGGVRPNPPTALSQTQEAALLAAVQGLTIEPVVRLVLYTGLRREEALGLTWQDVHLEGPAPHIDVRRALRWPKNNQPEISEFLKSDAAWRTIPIPPPLRLTLEAARKAAQNAPGSRTVISTPDGRPWTYQTFRRAWGGIEARTAREGRPLGSTVPKHPAVKITLDFAVAPHKLRRTYITRLILGGMDLRRVQYLAGHETADVTLQIYTALMGHQPEDLIDDVSAIFTA